MLENQLFSLKITLNSILYGFVPFYLVAIGVLWKTVFYYYELTSFLLVGCLIGIFFYAYFLLKYFLTLKTLKNYLKALKSKEAQQALTYGRIYYSVKRKGLFAADGSGLTSQDENAIHNDISVYLNI
ncbi:hypothetical protein [Mucilaginibacter ginsenosidivorax]|uniref:Uncharacterized protein n=1 Tax=Mucilaginibacter ginsenosidivorax TaxID=862126 RepID=A0A5B8W613_9SPHI|nr:hypothetical protein [Mucilaginibacter ginsenosidivorax]QEC78352.1 hypothetical protein FSB76_21285 [Mucilaginibacter ginsenosidivorax]